MPIALRLSRRSFDRTIEMQGIASLHLLICNYSRFNFVDKNFRERLQKNNMVLKSQR
jgi:hypothetical protein